MTKTSESITKALESFESETDIRKYELLLTHLDFYTQFEAKKAFYAALSEFQGAIDQVQKNGLVQYMHRDGTGLTSFKYAFLSDIAGAVRGPLSKHGLSYRFDQHLDLTQNSQILSVSCIVSHKDGHSETTSLSSPVDHSLSKSNYMQKLASTETYLRKIVLTSGLGVATGDDDSDAMSEQHEDEGCDLNTDDNQQQFYPDDMFEQNLPVWQEQINKGKDAGDVIAFLETKGIYLSDSQKETVGSTGK